jgi:hypothetical protein
MLISAAALKAVPAVLPVAGRNSGVTVLLGNQAPEGFGRTPYVLCLERAKALTYHPFAAACRSAEAFARS